jgi:predicted Zn-dependent protease
LMTFQRRSVVRLLSRLLTMGVLFSMCMSFSVAGERKDARVSMLTIGNVDGALRDRVVRYVKEQYGVAPVLRDAIKQAPATVDEMRRLLVSVTTTQDVCVLALCVAPAIEHEGMVFAKERCGAVNVSALTPKADAPDRAEALGRRAEKESLRAIALMVGIPPCTFPRCALYAHKSDAELDLKSRNPCPPCMEKIRARLTERGLTLEKAEATKAEATKAGAAKAGAAKEK